MGPKGKKNGIKGKSEINRPKFQKGFKQFKLGKKKEKGKRKEKKRRKSMKNSHSVLSSTTHSPRVRPGKGLA